MLWTNLFQSADLALSYFASRRTDTSRGSGELQKVAAPSQIRQSRSRLGESDSCVGYVKYMENLIKNNVDYISSTKVILSRISMHGVPLLEQEVCNLTFGPSLSPPQLHPS